MLRPMLPGSDTYGLSETLWGKVPLEYIFGYHDRNYGVGLIDNFTGFGRVGPNLTSSLAYYSGNGIVYRSFELVGGTVGGRHFGQPGSGGASRRDRVDDRHQRPRPGFNPGGRDPHGVGEYRPVRPHPEHCPGELYFEAYFKVSSITTAIYDCFVGLAGSGFRDGVAVDGIRHSRDRPRRSGAGLVAVGARRFS